MSTSTTRRIFLLTSASFALLTACSESESSELVDWDEETDVLILGGGGAGLVAAIEARREGAEVIVLEKSAVLGGNTIRSGGVVQAAGTAQQQAAGVSGDTPARHAEYWLQAGEGVPEPELVQLLADNAPAAIDFMTSIGVVYETVYGVGPIPYVDPDLMVDRIHVPGAGPEVGGGVNAFNKLVEEAEAQAVDVRLSAPARALIEDEDGRIVGVRAEIGGATYHIRARRAVILATGGFDNNKEIARQLSPQLLWELETGISYCTPENTGDGILMGMDVGADLAGVGGTIGVPAVSLGAGPLAPGLPTVPGVWVNGFGQRFVNEETHYSYAMRAVFDQQQHIAWAVFDETIKGLGGAAVGGIWGAWSEDLSEEIASGKVKTGATIEELATAIDVSPEGLAQTLQSWNEGVAKGMDSVFGKQQGLQAIDTGPYYATRVTSVNLGSCGGLRIDSQCRVIDVTGAAIAGLFAAGMVAGGYIGPYYPGSGTAVMGTIVFGRIAGKAAAAA